MKARIKDTSQILEVMTVKLENGFYYSLDKIEFEQEPNNTSDHWQDLRERAAIAILSQCLKIVQDVLWRGGSLTEDTIVKQAATNAVDYADALVKKLKGE